MKVTNNSKVRAYHVRNVMIPPGESREYEEDVSADIKGLDDLTGGKHAKAEEVEFKEEETNGLKKAELQALLDDAGVEYPSNANKAELQALVDGIEK